MNTVELLAKQTDDAYNWTKIVDQRYDFGLRKGD